MRLRVALKLLSREPPQSVALRRWRDPKGGSFMVPTPIAGDLMRAERKVQRARCRRGRHNIQPVDRLQTFAACVWCFAERTRVHLS